MELIQDLLPTKSVAGINKKIAELKKIYKTEFEAQREHERIMNLRTYTTQRRRKAFENKEIPQVQSSVQQF